MGIMAHAGGAEIKEMMKINNWHSSASFLQPKNKK